MKLNHECVRDVLLTVEEMGHDEYLDSYNPQEFERLSKYDKHESAYAIEKLIEAGYLNATNVSSLAGINYDVTSLTWHGHQFLDNIRDDGIWKNTKNAAAKIAGVSLPILSELATSYVKSKLGLS